MTDHLLRIVSRWFVAGVIVGAHGTVVRTAPIVRWMRGHTAEWVHRECRARGWECKELRWPS